MIELAFRFVAGDLYSPATDVELAGFRDSDPPVSLIIKTEPAWRVRQELYIRYNVLGAVSAHRTCLLTFAGTTTGDAMLTRTFSNTCVRSMQMMPCGLDSRARWGRRARRGIRKMF